MCDSPSTSCFYFLVQEYRGGGGGGGNSHPFPSLRDNEGLSRPATDRPIKNVIGNVNHSVAVAVEGGQAVRWLAAGKRCVCVRGFEHHRELNPP